MKYQWRFPIYRSLRSWSFFISLTILLTACGGGIGGAPGEKSLHFTMVGDLKTFNIITARDAPSQDIMSFVFEGLVQTNGKTFANEPCLADTWTISPDGLTWTFTLRKDVLWSDGEPFTVNDVIFTFNRLIFDTRVANSAADILQVDKKFFVVTRIDDFTFSFFTHKPFASFLSSMASVQILPEHKYGKTPDFNQALGINTPLTEVVGTGPFMIAELTPGQRIVLAANKRYWKKDGAGKPLPRLEKLIVHIVPDADASVEWFKSGRTDYVNVRGADWPVLSVNPKGYTMRNLGPRFVTSFICFNQNKAGKISDTKRAWFRDRAFREAVAYAIDRKTIIDGIYNSLAFEGQSPIAEANALFHDSAVIHYKFDLDRAAKILADAGYRKNSGGKLLDRGGNKISFEFILSTGSNEAVKAAVIIEDALKKLGMDVHVNAIDFNSLVDRLNNDLDWEVCMLGLTQDLDPHLHANVWRVNGDLHMFNQKPRKPAEDAGAKALREYQESVTKWSQGVQPWETEIENLINEGAETIDPAARWKAYSNLQRIVSRELPFVYTVTPAALYATRDHIKGFDPSPLGSTPVRAVLLYGNVERLSRE